MVIVTAFFAPILRAEEPGGVVVEPFPEDEAPLISQLDGEEATDIVTDEDFSGDDLNGEVIDAEPETIEPGTIDNLEIIDTDELFAGEMAAESAPVLSTADDIGPCHWYARGDLVLWTRSTPQGGILAIDTSPVDSLIELRQALEPLNSINASFRIEPAGRITLSRNLGRDYQNRDHSVEVVFLGGLRWDSGAAKSSRDRFELNVPKAIGTIGGFNRADTQRFNVEADFNSIELSVRLQRRPDSDRMVLSPDGRWSRQMNNSFLTSFMAGMRYIRATEKFNWQSRRTDVSEDIFRGDYDIETENNLVGLHIGTDTYWTSPNLRIGMRTQFGVMVNVAEMDSALQIIDPTILPPAPGFPVIETDGVLFRGAEDEAAAFVAEMGWSASYQMNPRSSFRVAYDFLWMQGTADATRQIEFNLDTPTKINFGGNTFYQGFSIGFERVW